MDDQMPLVSPPARRPLKRSASTASLPTPPRTHHKRTRGRSRGSCDSDSDDDVALSSDDEEQVVRAPTKKRRTGEAAQDNEEAFWLGGSAGLNSETNTATSSKTTSTTAPKQLDVPLLYRRLIGQTTVPVDVAPVSPPPSNRKSTVVLSPNFSDSPPTASPSPLSTPRTRLQKKLALRDSPNNPFLDTPTKQTEDVDTNSDSSPKTPTTERPTLTYVFRGVRRVYQNPLYNHREGRPYSPPPASKLPIDDPEYSPAINCTPKLLFPEARRAKGKKPVPRGRLLERSPSLSGDEDDDVGPSDIRPKLLDFGVPEKKAKTQTLEQELKPAGKPLST